MRDIRVEVLRVARAPRELREHGMLAWLRIRIGDIVVDGVSLREGLDGERSLSFPIRADARGRKHPVVHALDETTRRYIEAQVLAELEVKGNWA